MEIKKAYQEKADAQLREWYAWIEQYKSDAQAAQNGASKDMHRTAQRLEDCHRAAQTRLEELRSSQDDRWEFSKQAVERAMIELKRVLDESGAAQSARLLELQTRRSYSFELFEPRK